MNGELCNKNTSCKIGVLICEMYEKSCVSFSYDTSKRSIRTSKFYNYNFIINVTIV